MILPLHSACWMLHCMQYICGHQCMVKSQGSSLKVAPQAWRHLSPVHEASTLKKTYMHDP